MRRTLPSEALHLTIRETVQGFHSDVVSDVQEAVLQNRVIVVGMKWNGSVRKACQNLEKAGLAFEYIEYGSYVSQWHKRLALKMWTGFPTFPMIFVDQQLIGGNSELEKLIADKAL